MMRIIIITIVLLFELNILAQNGFEKRFASPQAEQSMTAIELPNKNILIFGFKERVLDSINYPYYIFLDSSGNTINEIHDTINQYIPNVIDMLYFDSSLTFISVIGDSLMFTKCDYFLNIKHSKSIYFSDSIMTISIFHNNMSDTTLVISGGITYQREDSNSYIWTKPFIIKLDSDFNEIARNFEFNNYLFAMSSKLSNTIWNTSQSNLIGLLYSGSYSKRVLFNDTLGVDLVTLFDMPIGTKPYINYSTYFDRYYIFSKVESSNIYRDVILGIFNNQFDTIGSLNYGGATPTGYNDTNNIPAFRQSISIKDNNIYVGGTFNYDPYNALAGGITSWFMLGKIGSNNKYIWKKRFGGDAYYSLVNVYPTYDGGCLLNGFYYNLNTSSFQSDIFIIKVDSNGQTTWTKNIELPKTKIKLFPNPTTDFINLSIVSSNKTIKEITIYNINGKQVLHQQINSQQTQLNVSSLASGIYIIEGYTQEGEVFREKFVVE